MGTMVEILKSCGENITLRRRRMLIRYKYTAPELRPIWQLTSERGTYYGYTLEDLLTKVESNDTELPAGLISAPKFVGARNG